MTETRAESAEWSGAAGMRRERRHRIANAERDRRAGRVQMAIAAIGEPSEWPSRVVLALARLPEAEGAETRRLLEEGLEIWARETGLEAFESGLELDLDLDRSGIRDPELDRMLDRPFDPIELDRAFAEAEAEVENMHDVNRVAERVLLDEPSGLAELAGESLERASDPSETSEPMGDTSRVWRVATLERWLQNLEQRRAGRTR